MPNKPPTCPLCRHTTKKNGTTSKGNTRWRCTDCGHSFVRTTQTTHTNAATMRAFITYATTTTTLTSLATSYGCSTKTLQRRFHWCWWIQPPTPVDPHRIYDYILMDATHLAGGCLLIASTKTHIINWAWCHRENSAGYRDLIADIPAPLMVVIDGGQGAQSAVTTCWPTTIIQRCLVHAQRVVRRHTTSRPRTNAGKAIYALALQLTRVHTTDQAADWVLALHDFGQLYNDWLNEKTTIKNPITGAYQQEYTHRRVRTAYHSLLSLHRRNLLFNFLQPPDQAIDPTDFPSTTNALEGGFNAPVKHLARAHRGMSTPHQRCAVDWWLYLKTQAPGDPIEIARSQRWGQSALTRAQELITHHDTDTNDDGAPAAYDTGIDAEYQHSMGIQQGWVGT